MLNLIHKNDEDIISAISTQNTKFLENLKESQDKFEKMVDNFIQIYIFITQMLSNTKIKFKSKNKYKISRKSRSHKI